MSEGIKKYSSILLKGTVAATIANSATKVVSFILLPIFTYYLSPKDYGIVSIVTMIATVFAHICNPGILTATTRLYHATDNEAERQVLIGSANRFFLFAPIIPIIICLLFGPKIFSWIFNDFSFYPYGLLALILTLIRQPARVWITLMTLQYKFHQATIYNGIAIIIGMLVTLLLIVGFKMGAMGKVLGMFPTALILFVISIITIRKYTLEHWNIQNIKKQILFGLPMLGALWSYQALELGGAYLLERMSDLKSVGFYAFGMAIAQLPLILVIGVRQLWNPVFYDNMNKKDYKTVSKLISYFIAGLTFINLFIVLFSKEAILILVNERFYEAMPIIGFLILGVYFDGLITISNAALGYKNKFGTISVFALIASVLFIGLNVLLIPQYDVMGAAIAFGASYFVFFLLSIWHQRKTLILITVSYVNLVPIISMIIVTFILYHSNQFFMENELNFIEILFKLLILSAVVLLFFIFKILTTNEFVYAYKLIINKIQRKK